MTKGLLIILSGPSGVGKGTVRKYIFSHSNLDIHFSVSMTTRLPRENETDGKDYYFVSQEEFDKCVSDNNFLEHASFVGHSYGTPKNKVEEIRNQGRHVLLEIEINGATQVLENCKGDNRVVSIFLMPPSIKTLENRIKSRNTESKEIIQQRIAKGIKEINNAKQYDYIVVNDRVPRASKEIIDILNKLIKKD